VCVDNLHEKETTQLRKALDIFYYFL